MEFLDEPFVDPKGLHVHKRAEKSPPLDGVDLVVFFRRTTMYLAFKNKMLHHIKHLAERIENLGHGRYLPVEVLAVDPYGKGIHLGLFTEIDLHANSSLGELDLGTVKPEVLCCVHKPQEMWDVIRELAKEENFKPLEARSGDPMNKCFQICANTSEPEEAKVRKRNGGHDRHMRGSPLRIMVGNREGKQDHERLQLGHK
jgi:hypothetical protein